MPFTSYPQLTPIEQPLFLLAIFAVVSPDHLQRGLRFDYLQGNRKVYVDVFLFDSLSSGAGYCSTLAERTDELIRETRAVLSTCTAGCDSACHECLRHYWNQRIHGLLDRYAALELLDWCEKSKLPEGLSYDEQEKLLAPLNSLGADFDIVGNGEKHYVKTAAACKEIIAYPAMWNPFSAKLPVGAIAVSDKLLKYALPKIDAMIREKI